MGKAQQLFVGTRRRWVVGGEQNIERRDRASLRQRGGEMKAAGGPSFAIPLPREDDRGFLSIGVHPIFATQGVAVGLTGAGRNQGRSRTS